MFAVMFHLFTGSVDRFLMIEDLFTFLLITHSFILSLKIRFLSFHIIEYDPSTWKQTIQSMRLLLLYVGHFLNSMSVQPLFRYRFTGEPHNIFWVMKLAKIRVI